MPEDPQYGDLMPKDSQWKPGIGVVIDGVVHAVNGHGEMYFNVDCSLRSSEGYELWEKHGRGLSEVVDCVICLATEP